MDIKEILKGTPSEIVNCLSEKSVSVPSWKDLVKEYDSNYHDVMNKTEYPDVVNDDGSVDKVTRITLDFQKLATKRITELVCGIPVKRVASPENQTQKDVAAFIEKIYARNRIDNFNVERFNMLFCGCEVMTLWYAKEESNNIYGYPSPIKLRCKNYSPTLGDELFPLFDEYGDLVALSVKYKRKKLDEDVTYFDTYTAEKHLRFEIGDEVTIIDDENITLGKIPAVYMYRPTPIWETTSKTISEMEMTLSRQGNYLRKNSKPVFGVFADEEIDFGKEGKEENEFRTIFQLPQGSSAQYITWAQATDAVKYHIEELKQMIFTQLQLPDFSWESMKSTPMSGEARKQLFIDAQLKVKDESGRILEFLDRELNVIKCFVKLIFPNYAEEIDSLQIENKITPFTVSDFEDRVKNLITATGGKQILSVGTAIRELDIVADPDKEKEEIQRESTADAAEMTW